MLARWSLWLPWKKGLLAKLCILEENIWAWIILTGKSLFVVMTYICMYIWNFYKRKKSFPDKLKQCPAVESKFFGGNLMKTKDLAIIKVKWRRPANYTRMVGRVVCNYTGGAFTWGILLILKKKNPLCGGIISSIYKWENWLSEVK